MISATVLKCLWSARMSGGLVFLLGIVVLVGWAFDIAQLKSVLPGLPPMVPNTAIAFILAGLSLWFLSLELSIGTLKRRTCQAAGLIITVMGALTLGEYLFGWRLPIDQLFFRESIISAMAPAAGRPALLTAVNFLLLGFALLLLDVKTRAGQLTVEILIVIPMLIALLAFIGYACNVPAFYGWRSLFPNTGMSLHSVVAFVLLGTGLLCARPNRGLMKVVTSATAGGVVARRLLLAPVIIPLFSGLFKMVGLRTGVYNPDFAGWFFAFLNICVFTIVIWWIATLLYRAETVRLGAEEEVRQLNVKLEQRVVERTAELKLAVEALQKSEAFLARSQEIAHVGSWELDLRGRDAGRRGHLYWSNETHRILGLAPGEVEPSSELFYSLVHPEDCQRVRATLAKALDESKPYSCEHRIVRPNGTARHVDQRANLIYDDATGAPQRVLGTIQDITERKQIEEALASERNILRTLIDHLPAYIYMKDTQGRYLVNNLANVRMNGASSEAETLGKTVFDFFPQEMARLYDEDDRRVIASGQPLLEREEPGRGQDGAERCFLTTKLPLRDAHGGIIGLLGITLDITERKQGERALRESHERTRAIFDTALDAVITMDHEGRIAEFNPAAERIFGYRRREAIGQPLADLIIPPALREQHRRGLARYLATGEAAVLGKRLELTGLRADGSLADVELSINQMPGDGPPLFAGFLRDITERKRSEHDLRESQQLLQAIIDNSPAVIYVKDLRGKYLLVNRRFSELFHLSQVDVVGKTDHDFFSKEAADAFRAMDQRVEAAGVALTEEEIAPHDDGPHTYVSVKCPLPDKTGQPYAVFGISTDITDRKRAEAKMAWLASFPENNPNPIVEFDLVTSVVSYTNPFAARLFPDLQSLGSQHPWLAGLQEAAKPLLEGSTEAVRRELVAGEFCYSQTISLAEDHRLRIYSSDITERKQAEEALRESEERFRTLAESLPHLVWTCRPDGWCDYLSRQWVEYTGRAEEQQLGYGWADHLHPEDRDRVQRAWTEATLRGDQFDIEFRIRRADGIYRWFKTRAVPLRSAAGNIVKWFGSNTDFEDFKQAEHRLQTQLERLNLLDQITRAIGERQDLQSVFQVVIRSLEDHLRLDFCCVCLFEPATNVLTVTSVGVGSKALAMDMAMPEQASIVIDQSGLSRCVQGQLVYEPDIVEVPMPFPQRLAQGGLRALVAAPLLAESQVFGVLVAARRQRHSFSSGECEFLQQLSKHVALAAHQAQLYSALQQAYDDLRQTQQAVMQQERLRALGQMASGIAHDINNAISPVVLYTESLLLTEANLSPQARNYLETIQRAVDDVAQTVVRMGEFYRQREPLSMLMPVQLNRLAQQVVDLTRARWSDIPQHEGIVINVVSEFAPDLPAIMGLESEIREALTNLIFNAVDAMPAGAR